MDQLRLLQQQQSWELQAKLGVLSGSELDALKRPQMKSSLMAAHNKWVTKPAELNATYISRKPQHRPPARSALLLTPLDQLDLLAAPSEHGTCSSPSEIEDDESLPDDDESDYDSITSPRSPGEPALAAAATASTAPPPGAHEASKSLGGTKGDGFMVGGFSESSSGPVARDERLAAATAPFARIGSIGLGSIVAGVGEAKELFDALGIAPPPPPPSRDADALIAEERARRAAIAQAAAEGSRDEAQSAQASALNALAARRQLADALAALEAAEAQAAEAKAEASAEKARSAAAQRAAEMATSKAEVAISKAEVAISRAAELEEGGRAAAAQRVEVERRAAVAEQAAADAVRALRASEESASAAAAKAAAERQVSLGATTAATAEAVEAALAEARGLRTALAVARQQAAVAEAAVAEGRSFLLAERAAGEAVLNTALEAVGLELRATEGLLASARARADAAAAHAAEATRQQLLLGTRLQDAQAALEKTRLAADEQARRHKRALDAAEAHRRGPSTETESLLKRTESLRQQLRKAALELEIAPSELGALREQSELELTKQSHEQEKRQLQRQLADAKMSHLPAAPPNGPPGAAAVWKAQFLEASLHASEAALSETEAALSEERARAAPLKDELRRLRAEVDLLRQKASEKRQRDVMLHEQLARPLPLPLLDYSNPPSPPPRKNRPKPAAPIEVVVVASPPSAPSPLFSVPSPALFPTAAALAFPSRFDLPSQQSAAAKISTLDASKGFKDATMCILTNMVDLTNSDMTGGNMTDVPVMLDPRVLNVASAVIDWWMYAMIAPGAAYFVILVI
ncbi:hypothetical protein Ctob_010226, partial [Chrysochromulina tobinii]